MIRTLLITEVFFLIANIIIGFVYSLTHDEIAINVEMYFDKIVIICILYKLCTIL